MRWNEIGDEYCSVARTLSVIGDRWTLLVLREAFMRTRRFDDFQHRTGAPRPVLADRLRTLVDEGVLERRRYGNHAERYDYRLTDKGRISTRCWCRCWRGAIAGCLMTPVPRSSCATTAAAT